MVIRIEAVPAAEEWKRTLTSQPLETRAAVAPRFRNSAPAGWNEPQERARHRFQLISATPPRPSLSVSRKRYAPARATLNGPTSTWPARGLKVNALTNRPLSDRRSSAAAERLVKKRSVTAQPTDVRATSGRPRLRTEKVLVWRDPGVLNEA